MTHHNNNRFNQQNPMFPKLSCAVLLRCLAGPCVPNFLSANLKEFRLSWESMKVVGLGVGVAWYGHGFPTQDWRGLSLLLLMQRWGLNPRNDSAQISPHKVPNLRFIEKCKTPDFRAERNCFCLVLVCCCFWRTNLSLSLLIVSTGWNYLSLQRVTDGEVAVLEYLQFGRSLPRVLRICTKSCNLWLALIWSFHPLCCTHRMCLQGCCNIIRGQPMRQGSSQRRG